MPLCIPYHDEYLFFAFLKLMTKEISAGIEGDTELGDQVSNHTVQYLLLDHGIQNVCVQVVHDKHFILTYAIICENKI